MSPEQVRGAQIDHRTDLYSLGITFFEMLTARKPFARGQETPIGYAEVIQGVLTAQLPDPRTFQPTLPPTVVRLLNRATAKDPAERFQTAGEFASALEMVEAAPEAAAGAPFHDPAPTVVAGAMPQTPSLSPSSPPPQAPSPTARTLCLRQRSRFRSGCPAMLRFGLFWQPLFWGWVGIS
ncbi:MAG: serine/threonine protein kinase with PASTA sensor(s), partial [Chlorobi bacterium OLB7]